jgi:hypothetical protein
MHLKNANVQPLWDFQIASLVIFVDSNVRKMLSAENRMHSLLSLRPPPPFPHLAL